MRLFRERRVRSGLGAFTFEDTRGHGGALRLRFRARAALGLVLAALSVLLGFLAGGSGRRALLRRLPTDAGPACLRQADRDRLVGGLFTVLALAIVLDLLLDDPPPLLTAH